MTKSELKSIIKECLYDELVEESIDEFRKKRLENKFSNNQNRYNKIRNNYEDRIHKAYDNNDDKKAEKIIKKEEALDKKGKYSYNSFDKLATKIENLDKKIEEKNKAKKTIKECLNEILEGSEDKSTKLEAFKKDVKQMIEDINSDFNIKCNFYDFDVNKTGNFKVFYVKLNNKSENECEKICGKLLDRFERLVYKYNKYIYEWNGNESYEENNKFCDGSITLK